MYYIIYGFLYLVSLLPLRILYILADAIYGLVYYIIRYRKDVVMNNLSIAFPEKTTAERKKIAKQFYHNFIDTFIESLKFISISKKQIQKRTTSNFSMINELAKKGYSINMMASHQFNWEFGNALAAMTLHIPFVGIYMPISNKALDKIFYNFRKRYGTVLIAATEFKNKAHKIFEKQYAFGLAADQNPGDPSKGYWMHFMGKPVPFLTGPAKGAVRNNIAVVMVGFKKIRRGYYDFHCTLLVEEGAKHTPEELTRLYKNEVEKTIRADPANYLWSHRRWKYDWKPEYGPILD